MHIGKRHYRSEKVAMMAGAGANARHRRKHETQRSRPSTGLLRRKQNQREKNTVYAVKNT
jgi:hypothetical protein